MIQQINIDLLKILEKSEVFSYAIFLIKECFKYNGYVAGGFARKLLLIHNNQFTIKQLEQEYSHYLVLHDIDFFFEDDMDLQKFYLREVANFVNLTKNAYEYTKQTIKFQIIKTFLGKPEDLISTFDLINVMVAFKNNVVYVHNDWLKYEKEKQVHVVSWHSPMIVSRLSKYSNQGLQLTQEVQQILPHAILAFIEQRQVVYANKDYSHKDFVTFSQLTTHIHHLISTDKITNANDLLLIASLHLKLHESYYLDLKLNDLIMKKLLIHNKKNLDDNQNP